LLKSHVLLVPIFRPYHTVYGFLADPHNFPAWGVLEPGSVMRHLGDSDYLVDLPRGRSIMRFTPPNTFGVLDYQVFKEGEDGGPVTPVRLHANEDGCELVLVWMQRPGVSDERFASDIEWVHSDLLRVKTYLEAR